MQINNFLQNLRASHKTGSELIHYAKLKGYEKEKSTMPVTPFIYEFFLYNTLYSIDWEKTQINGQITHHVSKGEGKLYESEKQEEFEKFLKRLAKKYPKLIFEAFKPLTQVSLKENWTNIKPDQYISQKNGDKFFKNLQSLQTDLANVEGLDVKKIDKMFDKIQKCRSFVYKVRNNVFHGSKSPGQLWDEDQRKRIEIYHLFLNCLVSSFFLLFEKESHS